MDLTSAMVEASSCLLCVVDVETGSIGAVNGVIQRLAGASEGELLGRSVWEVLELPFRPDELRRVLQPTGPIRIPLAFDALLRARSGGSVRVVWSGALIADPSGLRRHLVLTGINRS